MAKQKPKLGHYTVNEALTFQGAPYKPGEVLRAPERIVRRLVRVKALTPCAAPKPKRTAAERQSGSGVAK